MKTQLPFMPSFCTTDWFGTYTVEEINRYLVPTVMSIEI